MRRRSSLIPAALLLHVRPHGRRPRQGWALFAAMAILFVAAARRRLLRRRRPATRCSHAHRPSTSRPATWRARRSASASANRRSGPATTAPRTARSTPCTTASRRSAGWCRCSTSSSARSSSAASAPGFYGMLLFVVLTVFIAGLMVGRTPEYLGKKIEAQRGEAGRARLPRHAGRHPGLRRARRRRFRRRWRRSRTPARTACREILYAYSSATGNNGSAFAGFGADTPFHTTLGHRHDARPLRLHRADAGDRRRLAAKTTVAAVRRHLPDRRPAVRRSADRRRS